MNNPKHTPKLPFKLTDISRTGSRMILDGDGKYVANVQIYQTPRHMGELDEPKRESHAEYITQACNSFPELKRRINAQSAALAEIKQIIEHYIHDIGCSAFSEIDAAIAKARPE